MSVHSSHTALQVTPTRIAVKYTIANVVKLGWHVKVYSVVEGDSMVITEMIEEVGGNIITDLTNVLIEVIDNSVAGGNTNNEIWNTTIYEGDRVRIVRTTDGRVLWAVTTINDDGTFTVTYFDANNNQVFNIELDYDSTTNINTSSTVNTVSLWFEEGDEWLEFFEVTVVQYDGRIAYYAYIDINSDTVILGDRQIYREPEYRTVSGQVEIRESEWISTAIEVQGQPLTGIAVTATGFNVANSVTIDLEEGSPVVVTDGTYSQSQNTEGNGTRLTGRVRVQAVGKGKAVVTWRRRKPLVCRKYIQNPVAVPVVSVSVS
jgi:hypothetical protein